MPSISHMIAVEHVRRSLYRGFVPKCQGKSAAQEFWEGWRRLRTQASQHSVRGVTAT